MFSLQFESFFFAFVFISFFSGFCTRHALPTLAAAMLLCLLMTGCDFYGMPDCCVYGSRSRRDFVIQSEGNADAVVNRVYSFIHFAAIESPREEQRQDNSSLI